MGAPSELDLALKRLHLDDRDRMEDKDSSILLQLPDPCLLAVMRCCARDKRSSLFSAARAHIRLHQAAVLAASSIQAELKHQQQVDSVMLYLAQQGQHVSSLHFGGWGGAARNGIALRQLPHNNLPKLEYLELEALRLQLQPGAVFAGVLWAGAPLKRLQMRCCTLLDGEEGLAAALSLLTGLQHLSASSLRSGGRGWEDDFGFPIQVLQALPQLTYLQLAACLLKGPDGPQHLQDLTQLQRLQLQLRTDTAVSMLPHQLTHLKLAQCTVMPSALIRKTQLQHLVLDQCQIVDGSAGVGQLLYHLQQAQQLTHLYLGGSLRRIAPASAYSALTASTKLQQLNICKCRLPPDAWQHMFPVGRRLPHLQTLDATDVRRVHGPALPPGHCLVSCCPGLQKLNMRDLLCRADMVDALHGLSSLQELNMWLVGYSPEGVGSMCQLTGLRDLTLKLSMDAEGLLPQFTQQQHLTSLELQGPYQNLHLTTGKAYGPNRDEPVWRQLLRRLQKHSNPGVAQQAAAAMAE